jgi:hypothetical protein
LGSYLSINTASPWEITAAIDVVTGYTENFCLRCSHSKNGGTVFSDHPNLSYVQDAFDCSGALSPLTFPVADHTHDYLLSTSTVNVGSGFTTFFTHSLTQCPI